MAERDLYAVDMEGGQNESAETRAERARGRALGTWGHPAPRCNTDRGKTGNASDLDVQILPGLPDALEHVSHDTVIESLFCVLVHLWERYGLSDAVVRSASRLLPAPFRRKLRYRGCISTLCSRRCFPTLRQPASLGSAGGGIGWRWWRERERGRGGVRREGGTIRVGLRRLVCLASTYDFRSLYDCERFFPSGCFPAETRVRDIERRWDGSQSKGLCRSEGKEGGGRGGRHLASVFTVDLLASGIFSKPSTDQPPLIGLSPWYIVGIFWKR